MSYNLNLPNIPEGPVEMQVAKLRSYIHQTIGQLNFILNNLTEEEAVESATGLSTEEVSSLAKKAVKVHAEDKNNPHKVTAAQAGARPDTWTPTAEDVGARPNTWTPTAAEVGARDNTWLPTIADIGAAPAKKEANHGLGTAGWYRVGRVEQYHCCRMSVSTRYGSSRDMGAIIDICATYSNPVLNKTAAAFTSTAVKAIDQVRLVKVNSGYYVDIHYNLDAENGVFVLLDGPQNAFTAYQEWEADATGTAAVTLSL